MNALSVRRLLWWAAAIVGCAPAKPMAPSSELVVVSPPSENDTLADEERAPPDQASSGGVMELVDDARTINAQAEGASIGAAIQLWQVNAGEDRCPRYDELVGDKVLPPDSENADPWGNPYQIVCTGDGVQVKSDGPDQKPETDDDVISSQP